MRSAIRRALIGVVVGLAGGGLALMIALGRAGLVAAGGRDPGLTQHPAGLAPSFLVGFALGGALLGLLAPLRRTALGAFALGLIASGGFFVAVFVGLEGPPALWSSAVRWSVVGATLLLGLVLGGQLQPE